MNYCARGGQFETNAKVSFDIGFTNAAHDSVALPCLSDAILNNRGNGNDAAAHVLGQKRAALGVVFGFDILCKCLDIFGTLADFHYIHFFWFLLFKFFNNNALVHDAGFQFGAFFNLRLDLCLAGFQFFFPGFQFVNLCGKCVEVGVLCCQFRLNSSKAFLDGFKICLDFFEAHVFYIHVLTSFFH